MALLSNRRGGLGLLAIGPSGVRRAANERRASYMAAPRAPSVNASPGRPLFVDNPINGLFEGLGSVGKMLGEYGERKKAEAEKQKIEDAIKAAYAPMTEMKPVQRPEGLVYKGRGGVGDVTSGGPIAPPPGAKMGSTSQALQRREELDRSLALERKGGYGGLTYQPTRTEQVQTQRQRNAFERAQYFASKGLYDLAGKEMEMAKVEDARGNRTKDLELRRQIGERLANGDTKGAAALSLQLSDGAAIQNPLLNKSLHKENPKDLANGRFTRNPDGSITPNPAVIDALREEAQIKADIAAESKPATEAQAKAKGFAERMQGAEFELVQVTGFDPTEMGAYWDNVAPNFLASEQGQRYRQAAKNWISANLRKESGAVIGVEEMEQEFAKYFPQPGDAPSVVAQKARARAIALQGMIAAAGRHYVEPPKPPEQKGPTITSVED